MLRHYAARPPMLHLPGCCVSNAHSLCGETGVNHKHYAACSRPSPKPCPSKRHGNTLERRTIGDQVHGWGGTVTWDEQSTSFPSSLTRCSHPRPCATIPGAVKPSPTMWSPVPTGTPPHQPLCRPHTPVSKTLELVYERRPDADVGWITLEVVLGQVWKPQRRPQGSGFAKASIKSLP
jgi:hypothetical protein